MSKIDLAFIGNGIIATVAALKIKEKHPDLDVVIIGSAHRPFSASVAAGAMQAVFCEVEETFRKVPREREIFNIGLEARTLWRALLEKFGLKDIITAESTIMYRRKQGTLFEEVNFEAACEVANEYKCIDDVSSHDLEKIFCGNLKPADVIAKKFAGEFAIDTEQFFLQAQKLLEKMGVALIDDMAETIVPSSQGVDVILQNNKRLHASRVVIAAGTESPKLLPPDFAMVPMYHGVGTSMVLNSAPPTYSGLDVVIRTPNRGGAQCGMHIVPRSSGKFYLGASNFFSYETPAHRIESIRYLIDICDQELFGKQVVYNTKAELLLGSRPKTVDGYPIVGAYKACPAVFVATGTYRIGLTIAPVIAAEICRWHEGQQASDAFKNCSPERRLHSYASMEVAIRYYSESRLSNLVEHGILDLRDQKAMADKKIELESTARNFNAEIVKRHGFSHDFVVDPDMYSILMQIEVSGGRTCKPTQEQNRRRAI